MVREPDTSNKTIPYWQTSELVLMVSLGNSCLWEWSVICNTYKTDNKVIMDWKKTIAKNKLRDFNGASIPTNISGNNNRYSLVIHLDPGE